MWVGVGLCECVWVCIVCVHECVCVYRTYQFFVPDILGGAEAIKQCAQTGVCHSCHNCR